MKLKDMLTQHEKDFIIYWKENREKKKKIFRQLSIGIPIGFLFAIPIVINFVSGWYKRADMILNSGGLVLIIAFLLIIGFVAIFSQQHQWDMREQHYRELLEKQTRENDNSDMSVK
jgi:membrane protein YdbS with pleckstrin-like domain